MVKFGTVGRPNWPKCDILHICIMRKLVENCVHSFVKKTYEFSEFEGLVPAVCDFEHCSPRSPVESGAPAGGQMEVI